MNIGEILEGIFRSPGRQMAWGRIPANQITGQRQPAPFEAEQDYVIVRLGSMFLRDSRVLWLKFAPLAHATVSAAGRTAKRTESAVVGPAQFGDLATAPANRSVVLNQRLSGPTVWRGGDLAIDAGLFAVSRDEAAVALLTTVGQLAGLGVPGATQTVEVANIVKSGVESILGLQGTRPILGVREALKDHRVAGEGEAAGPCLLAGIAAPANEVDFKQLWVKDGRLHIGPSADQLRVYEARDHLLIAVERGAPREDWRGLPSLLPHEDAFKAALSDSPGASGTVQERANAAFRAFDADLIAEEELTEPDKDRIRGQVIADLQARIRRLVDPLGLGQPETRSVGGIDREMGEPRDFDFLKIGDMAAKPSAPAEAGALPFE